MRKMIGLFCCIGIILLAACSSSTNGESDGQKGANSGEKDEKAKSSEELIGEKVVEKDDSLELPFDEVVIEAVYSEDEEIKLFRTKDFVVLIDGEEVIHVDPIKSFKDPTPTAIKVSDDGRFATWRAHQEDWEISVYDVKDRQLDVVEKTADKDPYGIGDTPLIVQQDDTYYLLNNQYMFGYDVDSALDLVTKEIHSFGDEEDAALLQKLTPKERVSDDDAYTEVENKMYQLGTERGHESALPAKWTDYGYFEVYYDYKENEEDDLDQITELIGHDVEKGKLIDIPLEKEIDLTNGEAELTNQKLAIAENGHVLMPVMEQRNDDNQHTLSVYHSDLSKGSPNVEILLEEDVEDSEDMYSILFNADESGFYVAKPGKLQYYKL